MEYIVSNVSQTVTKSTTASYASVVLDIAIDKILDYSIPDNIANKITRGSRVEVYVRGHLRRGYVVEVKDSPGYHRVLPIKRILSPEELITDDIFTLALWMSKYYCSSLRNVFKTAIPATIRNDTKHKEQLFVMRAKTREQMALICRNIREKHQSQAAILEVMLTTRKGLLLSELLERAKVSRAPVTTLAKKGIITLDTIRIDRSPLDNAEYFITKPKILNDEQQESFNSISKSMTSGTFKTHLLHGITGSGKTEIYLQSIQKALDMGKGAIMLVPEIALTAQTIEQFRCRFKDNIAVIHHRLSHGERFDEWHKIRQGKTRIVIGARSAVFSPVKDLGLIIVDEEHENTYKQEDVSPCYHARDVAVMRGSITNSTVILGSATPSIESSYNARTGKYILNPLSKRVKDTTLPHVTIVDMKRETDRGNYPFADILLSGIKARHDVGEQTILFLNRRGYHAAQLCKACGHVIKCQECDVAMTFHRNDNTLSCHLCGKTISPPPRQCPSCGKYETMKYRGIGTEHIERTLHAIIPEIRTIRLDADTTRHKGSHQRLIRDFRNGKADVLIGTQMIAKGLHFPEVTLVGVLNSDSALNIPDFRASENTFQLITQVAGRAGRGSVAGEVVIQTYMPDNSIIKLAAQQDYEKFYSEEIIPREMFSYPPFSKIVKIAFSGPNESATLHAAKGFHSLLARTLNSQSLLHPVIPSGHARIRGKYRFQFLVRGPSIYTINEKIDATRQRCELPRDVRLFINVSPLSSFF